MYTAWQSLVIIVLTVAVVYIGALVIYCAWGLIERRGK